MVRKANSTVMMLIAEVLPETDMWLHFILRSTHNWPSWSACTVLRGPRLPRWPGKCFVPLPMENKLLPRLFISLLCALSYCSAQVTPGTLDFGVFSLFKPKHLLIRPAKNQTVLLTMSETSVALDSEFEVVSSREAVRIIVNGHSYRAESLLV